MNSERWHNGAFALDPMDGFDQHEACGERDGEEVALGLLAAERHPLEAFQLAHSDLDAGMDYAFCAPGAKGSYG